MEKICKFKTFDIFLTDKGEKVIELLDFVGNKKISGEMKYPLYWEDDKQFFIVKEKNVSVACSAFKVKKGNTFHLCSSFVFLEYRNNGIFDFLFNLRMELAKKLKCKKITGVATKMSHNTYVRYGFSCVKKLKNYFKMEKIL